MSKFEIISRNFPLVGRNVELVSRNFEIASRKNKVCLARILFRSAVPDSEKCKNNEKWTGNWLPFIQIFLRCIKMLFDKDEWVPVRTFTGLAPISN